MNDMQTTVHEIAAARVVAEALRGVEGDQLSTIDERDPIGQPLAVSHSRKAASLARLLQARDHLQAASSYLHPARWDSIYAPQLRILQEDILTRFSARVAAYGAFTGNLTVVNQTWPGYVSLTQQPTGQPQTLDGFQLVRSVVRLVTSPSTRGR